MKKVTDSKAIFMENKASGPWPTLTENTVIPYPRGFVYDDGFIIRTGRRIEHYGSFVGMSVG